MKRPEAVEAGLIVHDGSSAAGYWTAISTASTDLIIAATGVGRRTRGLHFVYDW